MRPLIMALLAIVITTSACRKERANIDTRVIPPAVRLKEIIETTQGGQRQYLFRYNDAGYLQAYYVNRKGTGETGWVTDIRILYTLDKANRVASEQWTSGMTGTYDGTYIYDSKNQLQRVDYSYNGANSHYVEYARLNGRITWATIRTTNDDQVQVDHLAYNAAGNVTEHIMEHSVSTEEPVAMAHNTEYDDKPNYVNTIKGLTNFVYVFGIDAQTLSANNLLRNEYDPRGLRSANVYELTYNKYNYVAKEVLNGGERVREFTYEEIK